MERPPTARWASRRCFCLLMSSAGDKKIIFELVRLTLITSDTNLVLFALAKVAEMGHANTFNLNKNLIFDFILK